MLGQKLVFDAIRTNLKPEMFVIQHLNCKFTGAVPNILFGPNSRPNSVFIIRPNNIVTDEYE